MDRFETADDAVEPLTVNYLPGSPGVSTDPGLVERFLTSLLKRRGALRPASDTDEDRNADAR